MALKACAMVATGAAIGFLDDALSLAMASVRVLDHLPRTTEAVGDDFTDGFHAKSEQENLGFPGYYLHRRYSTEGFPSQAPASAPCASDGKKVS